MTLSFRWALPLVALVSMTLPVVAEPVTPNRLDCHFSGSSTEMTCPSVEEAVTEGRAATEQQAPAAPQRGTPEWNQACAAKFKSFNPDTGTYTAYSGQEKPCT